MQDFQFEDIPTNFYEVSGSLNEKQILGLEEAVETLESIGTIKSNFRKESKFIIGEPISRKLAPDAKEVTDDIRIQLDRFDFYLVQLAVSFQPAAGCRFHNASFEVTFTSEPANPSAIAYDLQPEKIEDEAKVSPKFSIDPNLKIKLLNIDMGLSGLVKAEFNKEYIGYTSRIAAVGLQTSQASWIFTRTNNREINGSYRLIMTVRKPKKSKVIGKMNLKASQEFLLPIGPIGPIPLTTTWRKEGRLVDNQVIIFES
jgi:hypothetical protein